MVEAEDHGAQCRGRAWIWREHHSRDPAGQPQTTAAVPIGSKRCGRTGRPPGLTPCMFSRMPKVERPLFLPQPAVGCPVPGPSDTRGAREEILEAVQRAFEQYEQERLQACCLSLLTSWRGCLADGGGNRHESHTGLRIQAKNGKDLLGVPRAVVEEARAALARLQEEAETLQGGGAGRPRTR